MSWPITEQPENSHVEADLASSSSSALVLEWWQFLNISSAGVPSSAACSDACLEWGEDAEQG